MLFKQQNIRFNQPAQQMELFIYVSVVPFKLDMILSSLLQIFNWKSLYTNYSELYALVPYPELRIKIT